MIPFMIDGVEAERLESESGMEIHPFLASLVHPTCSLARPPISRFRVGAIGVGSSGKIFRGVNLEFPGLPLQQSVHAEQFLIANMAQNGEKSVRYLAVSAAPCGHCRQFLQELRGAPELDVLIVDGKNCDPQPLSDFLPHRFGPDDLLAENLDFPLLLEPRNNGLSLVDYDGMSNGSINRVYQPTERLYPGTGDRQVTKAQKRAVRDAALDAANKSYAPYTNCPSGLAILTKKSEVFAGSYCESAAYNPSLPPLQAAIVAFVVNGGGGYEEIEYAVLVERHGVPVQQAATTRMVLDQISPGCPLLVYYAETRIE